MKLKPLNPCPPRKGPLALKPILQWESPRFGRVIITFHAEGGPLRHVITHGSRTKNGAHPSVKMGRTMPWSSISERALIRNLDYRYDVQGFLVQPCELRWIGREGPQIYFPDAIAEINHGIHVLEAKQVHPNVHGLHKGAKYREAAEVFSEIGWNFAIKTTGTLTANVDEQLNFRDLFRAQQTLVTLRDELHVRDILQSQGGVMLYRTLAEQLAVCLGIGLKHAEAIILAMSVRGHLRFNLEKRITAVSPVTLMAPRAPGMKILNFWENSND